jgi:hypothetical protein
MVRPKGSDSEEASGNRASLGESPRRHFVNPYTPSGGERSGHARDRGSRRQKTGCLLAVGHLSYVRRPWNLTFMIVAVARSSTMVAFKPGLLTSFW